MHDKTATLDPIKLIEFRNRKNITQKMVSNALGVSVNTVSRWEISKFQSIKWSDLAALINYYGQYGLEIHDYTESIASP
jgi:transcriptional regulator with XRE-family HTH domain